MNELIVNKTKISKAKSPVKLIYENDDVKLVVKGTSEYDTAKKLHQLRLLTDMEYCNKVSKDEKQPFIVKTCTGISINKIKVASQSLVGVTGNPPFSHGNYWSAVFDNVLVIPVNIWVENFNDLASKVDKIDVSIINNDIMVIHPIKKYQKWFLSEPFLTYNLHREMSRTEKQRIIKWYDDMFGFNERDTRCQN